VKINSLATIGVCLGVLTSGGVAWSQSITYGPIIGRGVTADQMIVKWGTGATNDPTSVGFRVKGAGNFTTVTGSSSKDHTIVLTGLSTDTQYEYYVGSGAGQSATTSFATCPKPGEPMDIVFYGDSRSDMTEHQKVVDQILTKAPEMVFESGDLRVDGTYAGYLSEFFPVVKTLAASTPFMAVPGNHEYNSSVASNYELLFPSPQPAGQATRTYYSFTCGDATFIGLDGNIVGDMTQLAFLKSALAAAKADATVDHVFVWFHQSAYSPGQHGDSSTVKSDWVPLFDAAGSKVTAVFSGHDHIYARMNDGSQVAYVVSGGAGAGLYTVSGSSSATVQVKKSTYNFVLLHIVGGLVTATAYDDGGNQIDSFSLGMATPGSDGGVVPPGSDGGVVVPGSDGGSGSGSGNGGGGGNGAMGSQSGGCSISMGGGSGAPVGGAGVLAMLMIFGLALRRRAARA
jgi:MYXO-CTERM domain-containing protein